MPLLSREPSGAHSPCRGRPWPALLCQFESSRVIFDYTRGKVAASIRPGSAPRENVHFNEYKTRMDLRSYGAANQDFFDFISSLTMAATTGFRISRVTACRTSGL